MICNNCGKELEGDEIICTQCGQDNGYETIDEEKTRINPWKIAFPATVSFGLLLVLCWLLFFGVNGYWIPRANNIYNKESYTADADILQANRNNVVATIGKNKLTNAQLQVFYSRVCMEYKGEYSSGKPLDEQIYDDKTGLTWQQYLLELALNTWKQYRILTDIALNVGYQLPVDYQQSLDTLQESLEEAAKNNGYASVDALLSADVCEGCTFEDYKYFLELNYYANQYFEKLTYDYEVTQEEIEQQFEESKDLLAENSITKDSGMFVDYRHILVKAESDPDGITFDQWEACKEKAEEILDQWFLLGPTEENFAKLAMEKSDDKNTANYGGLNTYIPKGYLTKVDIRHILIMPEGGTKSEDGKTTVYSEAEWEDCRKKAQEIYDTYLNGERTEENFSLLAMKHSKDGNAADGGIYTNVQKGAMVEEFDAWIFDESRQPGDTGLVKTQYGYHVMYFVHRDDALNEWLFGTQRKYGEYGIVKSDEGYHVVFYVEGDEGWIRLCKDMVKQFKANQFLLELDEQNEVNVRYGRVFLSE